MSSTFQNQSVHNRDHAKYSLSIRQQPLKARLCSFKDKVDRRPLDPPPIIQIFQNGCSDFYDYKNSSNYFVQATLTNASDDSDIHVTNRSRTTAGATVQSLYKLKDTNNKEGAFFIFSDINIRIEGTFKLKFTLFKISGLEVVCICSVLSDPFTVYPSKCFPGMGESTLLTRFFSDQGVRIRIRKEIRSISLSRKLRHGIKHEHKLKSEYQHHYIHPYYHSLTPHTKSDDNNSKNAMSMENLLAKDTSTTVASHLIDKQQKQQCFPLTSSFETICTLPAPRRLLPTLFSNSKVIINATTTTIDPREPMQEVFQLPSLRETHLFADEQKALNYY